MNETDTYWRIAETRIHSKKFDLLILGAVIRVRYK